MKRFLAAVLFALILQGCLGATIQGELFSWETLEKIDHAIIDVNSVPPQRIVTENGSYSFEVPVGVYEVAAMEFIEGKLASIAREAVIVQSEGSFNLDLVLKKATGEDARALQEKGMEAELFEGSQPDFYSVAYGVAAFALLAAAYLFFKGRKLMHGKEKRELGEWQKREVIVDKYAEEVLDALRKGGNRLSQKELRERVQSVGEAKISLILTELEAEGKIKKIKRGRGNVIVLRETKEIG